jgi:predicted ATPase
MTFVAGAGVNRLVGRDSELTELVESLDNAIAGNGSLVMLVGEPGIGKTRLAEELAATAKQRGTQIAWGVCYDSGSTPPYWPWTQVIRWILTGTPQNPFSAPLQAARALSLKSSLKFAT